MQKPLTTALILNYRTPTEVGRCLEALVEQGLHAALVVDNSADGGASLERIRIWLGQWNRPLRVELLDSGGNLGFAAGVNLGLAAIPERFGVTDVLLVNSDARPVPGMLSQLHEAASVFPQPALVEAEQVYPDGRSRGAVVHYHRALGLFFRKPAPGTFRFVSGCCLLIPAALAKAPLYDEAFFIYGEDVELSWRLSRQGCGLVHAAKAQVVHEGGASTRPGSYFYEYHMNRGHLLLARKLATGSGERFFFLLLRVPVLGVRALWRSIRSRRLVPLRACWGAFVSPSGTPVRPT